MSSLIGKHQASMNRKPRDFYHMQDIVPLIWRQTNSAAVVKEYSDALAILNDEIVKCLAEIPRTPEVNHLLGLVEKKNSLLSEFEYLPPNRPENSQIELDSRPETDVSLSSSGMGFFSPTPAEEDQQIEIFMFLETIQLDVCLKATILESKVSADSEHPGFWLRARFDQNQELDINNLLAHVTERQIAKLKRREQSSTREAN